MKLIFTFLLDHKWTGTTIKIISCLYAWLILFFFFSIQMCGWFSILSHISCMSNLTCTLPNTFIPRYTFRPIIQLSAKLLNISQFAPFLYIFWRNVHSLCASMCNKHGSYHQRKDVEINSFFLMSIQSKEEASEYSNFNWAKILINFQFREKSQYLHTWKAKN